MNILCALARGPLEAKLGDVRATTSIVWTESRAPNFCFKGSGDRVAAYHDSRNARLIQWNVTEYPILDQRFEVLVMRLPTPREEHHMFGTAPLRRLQHAPRVGSIVSKRLFAENVQAVIDRRERH